MGRRLARVLQPLTSHAMGRSVASHYIYYCRIYHRCISLRVLGSTDQVAVEPPQTWVAPKSATSYEWLCSRAQRPALAQAAVAIPANNQ